MSLHRVVVLGLGKVGSLVGTLLNESGFKVSGLDAVPRMELPFETRVVDLADAAALRPFLEAAHAVVSCLPFHLNIALSREAHGAGIHYFDLTEDVATTDQIREMAKTSKGLMAPQCGLAPGFIGVVGADLARKFDRLRSIELKVGALPRHPRGKLGYAFNWSPEGVINEYINDCEVIRMGHRQLVPALEGYEVVVIDGVQLEAATTSGGLGTMCETYEGKVETLHYKTMRYLGHFEHIKVLFQELRLQEDRATLGRIMKNALPPVAEDYVFVHAAVEGWRDEQLSREEFVRSYPQMQVAGSEWRAISWTTAASLCAVIEMVRDEILPQQGFLKQESIPLDAFLKTKNGAYYLRQVRS
ncbi:MAG: saccharopine dehydrogenase NADP-binding domain-containing protein [Vicinamibacteria bacterium]|nr:saccharopine dehydrogenase NADP-binding domain-containing protein [Vicinamibacteria bacterium]